MVVVGALKENAMSVPAARLSVTHRLAALNALPESPAREDAILAAMEDEAPAVRERAIRLATRYLEPAVLGEMVADEANAIRRNAAITALERQGPYALQHLQIMLRQENTDVVMFALQVLARIGDPAAAPAVVPLVNHPELNVAQSAVEALGQLGNREAVPTLLGLLDRDLWLQLAAIDALGAIGDPRAVAPLVALVPDSVVAEPALQALRRLAAPESLEPLLARLPLITERSLRDSLLLAIGVVSDLHPDAEPIAVGFRGELLRDGENGIRPYLEQLLRAHVTSGYGGGLVGADGRDEAGLLRAAAALVVVARLEPLYPLVLIRIAEAEGAEWAEALFRQHPAGLRQALDELLASDDPRVRRGALLSASLEGDDLGLVMPHLSDPHASVRAAACRALGHIGAAESAPLLVERLRGGEPVEQTAAAQALAMLPGSALQELESCLLPTASEAIKVRALEVLGNLPTAIFESQILELTRANSATVRRAALRAVAQLPGSRAEVALIRALADRNQPVQLEALELLVRRGGAQAVTTLVALLGAGDSLRYHVIRALGHLQAHEATGKLLALYEECGPHERLEILWALIRIAPSELWDFLRARLAESETEVRRVAAYGIAEHAEREQLAQLIALASDPDWNVRNEAARGLGRLGGVETQATLLTLVRDVEPIVARTARKALEQLPGDVSRVAG
jgi:HEAT repeat protein